ncbi:MAG TPA: hypothetical protein VF577_04570 [Allosphingosinicella sp.]|jgi:hypothetical protein
MSKDDEERRIRLADALRQNLKRRKAQARAGETADRKAQATEREPG